jgi:hypothetical protein
MQQPVSMSAVISMPAAQLQQLKPFDLELPDPFEEALGG